MNWWIVLIESVILSVIFNLVVFISLSRNPVWWIHDYPKDIQDEYFKTHERIPAAPLSKEALTKKGVFFVIAMVVMVLLMVFAGAKTFLYGFLGSYFIWFVINVWDCFIMDWILFANMKSVRLPGTENMDKAYHQKKYHFVHGLIGLALGIIPCVLVGIIIFVIR